MADWHYIGHYGQLGPLTDSQMGELIAGGVIERSTYVWREGMPDWLAASAVGELASHFASSPTQAIPPPPPPSGGPKPFGTDLGVIGRDPLGGYGTGAGPTAPGQFATPGGVPPTPPPYGGGLPPMASGPYSAGYPAYGGAYPAQKSDKSRIIGGLLNFIPGVGRMYLGYPVVGTLQLLAVCAGIGVFWAWIDALLILTGNVKEDGYGRELL